MVLLLKMNTRKMIWITRQGETLESIWKPHVPSKTACSRLLLSLPFKANRNQWSRTSRQLSNKDTESQVAVPRMREAIFQVISNWHKNFAEDLRANGFWFNAGDQRLLSWRCKERESFALTNTGPDTKHDPSVSAPWVVFPMPAER